MRKYFFIGDNPDAGGGEPPAGATAPKGYTPLSIQQREDWNKFLDYAGTKGADLTDPKMQTAYLTKYKQSNPNFSITPDLVPSIQYEAYQLRKGDKLGDLGSKELGYIRQGLNPNFLSTDTANVGKLRYPVEGTYGTDIEGYYKSKFGGPEPTTAPAGEEKAPAKVAHVSPSSVGTPGAFATNSPGLPATYASHDTALKRVNQLAAQPGNQFLHGRGDALINANYVPAGDKLSFRDSSAKATKALGLDPNMFWASAAEEGATGLIPDKQGNIATDPDIDTSSKYPISGFANFGVDHFHGDFKELVRRGYLPANFDYEKSPHVNEQNEKVMSGNFKTVEDALQAKAAYIRMHQDDLDGWAKDNKRVLSPTARQFFTYISYNGGPGTAHKLINYYQSHGLLQGDQFLKNPPPHELDKADSYKKVLPRYQVAQVIRNEKLFGQ